MKSFSDYSKLLFTLFFTQLKQSFDKLIILTAIYSLISFLASFLYLAIKEYTSDNNNGHRNLLGPTKNFLIVTAHPDDECMFFGPTILYLRSKNKNVRLLCLSPGDSGENQRFVRKDELWKSCKVLGLDENNITLKKHTLLQDGLSSVWSHELVANIILSHIETYKINSVITFDENGVSQHSNHTVIFDAMAYLSINHILSRDVTFYSLDTVNRLRKYSLMFDFLTSFFLSQYCIVLGIKQQVQVVKAMWCHKSQLVWFRRLYMLFSRYVSINTLKTWTNEELKFCIRFENLISLKYKNKWYESLDDSLKKINSEQVIAPSGSTFTGESGGKDFLNTEDDDDDIDVSFKVKTSSKNSNESELNDDVTNESKVKSIQNGQLVVPNESSIRTGRRDQPHNELKLAQNESIHNGEVYIRKNRFLIPKNYGYFYNSSSDSSEKEDTESTSSISDTISSSERINSDEDNGQLTSTAIIVESLSDSSSNNQMNRSISNDSLTNELLVNDNQIELNRVCSVNTIEDRSVNSELINTIEVCSVNENKKEDSVSYSIEDIDSVLTYDVDGDNDIDGNRLGKDYDKHKSGDHDVISNYKINSDDTVMKYELNIKNGVIPDESTFKNDIIINDDNIFEMRENIEHNIRDIKKCIQIIKKKSERERKEDDDEKANLIKIKQSTNGNGEQRGQTSKEEIIVDECEDSHNVKEEEENLIKIEQSIKNNDDKKLRTKNVINETIFDESDSHDFKEVKMYDELNVKDTNVNNNSNNPNCDNLIRKNKANNKKRNKKYKMKDEDLSCSSTSSSNNMLEEIEVTRNNIDLSENDNNKKEIRIQGDVDMKKKSVKGIDEQERTIIVDKEAFKEND